MNFIAQIFKEDNGNYSAIRVFSFLALIIGATLSFTGSTYDIILMWIVAAFAPKAIQKFAEK